MQMSTPKQSKLFNYEIRSPSPTASRNGEWTTSLPTTGDDSGSPLSSSCGGSPADPNDLSKSSRTPNDARLEANSKRGRPRSEALTTLMIEGSTSPSAIKCKYCNRVFPRDKSLQAHLRTHTGERPYSCDYPGCTRAFTQSGQLKTHQRLHTGERPFICSAKGCQMRFTHANRHCPDHPYDTLKRCDDDFVIQPVPEEQSTEILKWLQKYREERHQQQQMYPHLHLQQNSPSTMSTPTRKTPSKRLSSSSSTSKVNDENNRRFKKAAYHEQQQPPTQNGDPFYCAVQEDKETNLNYAHSEVSVTPNFHHSYMQSPQYPSGSQKSVRKGLMCELDMNAGQAFTSPSTSHQHQSLFGDETSLVSSPLSSSRFGKVPKVIAWKEPVENDDDYLSDQGGETHYVHPSFSSTPCNSGYHEAQQQNNKSSSPDIHPVEATSSPKQLVNPKKKWLKDSWHDDLGTKPLDASDSSSMYLESNWQMGRRADNSNPNQMRPTVLMVASKDTTRPMDNNTNLLNRSLDSALTYHPNFYPSQQPPPQPQQRYMSSLELAAQFAAARGYKDDRLYLDSREIPALMSSQSEYYDVDHYALGSYATPPMRPRHEEDQQHHGVDIEYRKKVHGAFALMQMAADEMAAGKLVADKLATDDIMAINYSLHGAHAPQAAIISEDEATNEEDQSSNAL